MNQVVIWVLVMQFAGTGMGDTGGTITTFPTEKACEEAGEKATKFIRGRTSFRCFKVTP